MRRTANSAKRTFAGHAPRQSSGSTYSSAGLVLPNPRHRTLVLRPEARPATPRSELQEVPQWHAAARRGINVVASIVLILLTAPLMLGIAIAIKLNSRGPVLYRQKRVGIDRRRDNPEALPHPQRQRDLGGRIFEILKFRTMTHRAESEGPQVWAEADDPRVTAVGRFLRTYRLDELPQLFNVLKGDMNLVGPRPEQPEIFHRLRTEIDGYQYRQRVLPGITGLAQVNLHYDQCLEDVRRKVCLDLMYVEKESPLEDLRIMARTVPVVLFGQGSQ